MSSYTFLETRILSTDHKKKLYAIWKKEYPVEFHHEDLKVFDLYLSQLDDIEHTLVFMNDELIGWFFDFLRFSERWFGILLDSSYQRIGLGSALLDRAKKKHKRLCGWMTDVSTFMKPDGTPYASPRKFYEKHHFSIDTSVHAAPDKLYTVKIYWEND